MKQQSGKKGIVIAIALIVAITIGISACKFNFKDLLPTEPITTSTESPNTPSTPDTTTSPSPTVDPSTHVCVFGDWETIKEVTNTEDGLRQRKCECGKIEQEIIEAPNTEFYIQYRNLKSAEYPTETGYNSKDGLLNLPQPEAVGYRFVGWYTAYIGGELVDCIPQGSETDYVLYAHWELITYNVVFYSNSDYITSLSYNIETGVSNLPVPFENGYTFVNWYQNSNLSGEAITAIEAGTYGNIALYAKWALDNYSITFNSNGGSKLASQSYNIETEISSLPTPTKSGYTFVGWYQNSNFIGNKITRIAKGTYGNIQLYAKWTACTYIVQYDANGGEGTMESTTHYIDTPQNLAQNTFTKTGHTFSGWEVVSQDGVVLQDRELIVNLGAPAQTIVLKAIWVKNEPVWAEADSGSFYFADFPDGFDTNNSIYKSMEKAAYVEYETETTKRVVTIEKVGYVYWHWMYDTSANAYDRIIYYKNGTYGSKNYVYQYFGAFTSTKDYQRTTSNQNQPTPDYYWYYVDDKTSNAETQGSYYWYRFEYYICTYTDYVNTNEQQTPNVDPDVVHSITTKTGTLSSSPKITYSAQIEYRNRTANSVEIRVIWKSTIKAGYYNVYGQNFKFSAGSANSGTVKVAGFNTWKNESSSDRTSTGTSEWITIPLNTTNATSIDLQIYYWQTNSNGLDMYKYDGTPCVNSTWTINIPAY